MTLIIASTTNRKYGDVFVGYKNRDEDFVKQGFYKMQGEDIDDLSMFIPSGCTCIHYADEDVKNNVEPNL
jgi:hypothetical protein